MLGRILKKWVSIRGIGLIRLRIWIIVNKALKLRVLYDIEIVALKLATGVSYTSVARILRDDS